MTAIAAILGKSSSHLRLFNSSRDMKAAVELVDLCFSGTLDPDGQSYLRQLRQSANSPFTDWSLFSEPTSLPNAGYVWEEDHRLVGYVSLIPFYNQFQRCYLIANVSVHPDYRNRGIGRALTGKGLDYARERNARATWLQVRDDNPAAVHIYQTVGFIERARRTTWACERQQGQITLPRANFFLGPRRNRHWPTQRAWLDQIYPSELAWHLPLDRRTLETGWKADLYRLFTLNYPRQWAAEQNGNLLAALSHQQTDGYADNIWLAIPPDFNELAVRVLLQIARRELGRSRPLTLNIPAGLAAQAIQDAGFHALQTLLWMEYQF